MLFDRSRSRVLVAAFAIVLGAAWSAAAQSAPGMFENLSLFVGPDGSKQPQDLGINAHMGIRLGANLGFPLSEAVKLGAQIGVAENLSDSAVHVLDQVEGTSRRTQTFVTAGVFQRPTPKFNWGVVYDLSLVQYYDDFTLGQVRGQVGFGVRESDEVGLRFAKALQNDDATMGGTPVYLDPITQVTGYHRHTWANAAQTSVWVGVANGHHNVVWVFPDNSRDKNVLVYGAELSMPLSERFAITGATNLVTPTATGTVDAYLGVTFYPGRSGLRAARNTFSPIVPVANNPEMAINMSR
jgi:hypothetical protein